jgi:uncharacterized protein (DUF58 family)
MKTKADRKDQWERLAWRMSARTGEPYAEAMGTVAVRAIIIYIDRLVRALLEEIGLELKGKTVKDSRFKHLLNQYPYEAKHKGRTP